MNTEQQNKQTFLSLPALLKTEAGERIKTAAEWRNKRRPEILELFRTHVFGRAPVGKPGTLRFESEGVIPKALSGKATYKQSAVHFSGPGGRGKVRLFLFIPAGCDRLVPVFLLVCHLPPGKIDLKRDSPFWPVEKIVERGYAAAAFYTSDVDPDIDDGFKNGVHGIFDRSDEARPPDAWGTIAAWAWGAGLVMDCLEAETALDHQRVAIAGHSRGGKTALWCGACDERFALVISNSSGCTGAALARHKQGETVKKINTGFPHWFCDNYKKYNDREDELPVDQHQLLAMIAPRRMYVSSAADDWWADPQGEFFSCIQAEPVYRLFGLPGLGSDTMPVTGQSFHNGYIGYHLRDGGHDLTLYDWQCYLDYTDKHWK